VEPNTERQKEHLCAATRAITKECYNNPGVVFLSLSNETRTFQPAEYIDEVLAIDPERMMIPISGHIWPEQPLLPQKSTYELNEAAWKNVIESVHPYRGWYLNVGEPWEIAKPFLHGETTLIGEYGAEALDSYETMLHYPDSLGSPPLETDDVLWGHIQVEKCDPRQIHGYRGKKPTCLGEYIEASQTYQKDIVAMETTAMRLSPSVNGYFQYHFIDVLAANWPKSIVSFDLTPKKAYFEMAQVNQPLVPLFLLSDRAQSMGLWVSNHQPVSIKQCTLKWDIINKEEVLLTGKRSVDIPQFNTVCIENIDLSPVASSINDITVCLSLCGQDGNEISRYVRNVYIKAWMENRK
jgi:hypothetical protein